MKRAAVFTFCLVLILSMQGHAQGQSIQTSEMTSKPQNSWKAQWRLRLSGTDTRDERSQSKLVGIQSEIKSVYKLTNYLALDIQPTIRLRTGQTQEFEGADNQDSGILLNQAAVHYLPFRAVKVSGGALNQRHLHSDLLVDRRLAFPAARAEIMSRTSQWRLSVTAETAIPTSRSLSTNTKELEKTPSLNSAGFKVQWKKAQNFGLSLNGAYFSYNNLPSTVAQGSGLLGNFIVPVSESHYEFLYEHRGYQAGLETQLPVSRHLNVKLGADYIRNTEVPEELGVGYKLFSEARLGLKRNIDLILRTEYFSMAPEAAVSFFNYRWYETNRNGYSAETSLAFNKERFEIGVRYIDSEIMYQNTTQSREKTWFIMLETFYADI